MSEIETRPANNTMAGKKRNPYTVWFVVLAFIAPVVLAYIMFFLVDVKSFINHGEILDPIVHISSFKLTDEENEIIPQAELTYKWRLISFLGKDCDQACESRNTIKEALGINIRNEVSITNNEVYIMDPMGNVMMRFTQEQPNKEFMFDLKKLLKASQIG
jgi:cytochrome oxidase Cu insertion factor (SCO1/SenC/PrrC family)